MKIANADKLKKHFESVVDVHLFTVPTILTIIDRFSMNMAITDDEKMLSLNDEYVIVPSLEEGEWEVVHTATGETKCKCNQCQHYIRIGDDKNYCPNCGAWMTNSPGNKLGGDKP